MAIESRYFEGVPTVGNGTTSRGLFDSADGQTAIKEALLQYGSCFILPGVYQFTEPLTGSFAGCRIMGAKSATLRRAASGTHGLFNLTGADIHMEGFKIESPSPVLDQTMIEVSGAGCTFRDIKATMSDPSLTGLTTNPQKVFYANNAGEVVFDSCTVLPTSGVIGWHVKTGVGFRVKDCSYVSGINLDTPDITVGLTIRDGWIGVWLDACSFGDVTAFRSEKIGSYLSPSAGRALPKAAIYVSGGSGLAEAGHLIIDRPMIELFAGDTANILIEDAYGWIQINNPFIGFAGNQIFRRTDAGIKITGTTSETSRVKIISPHFHNLGRTPAIANSLVADAAGSLTAISAAAADNSYNKTTGSWTRTPLAGEVVLGGSFTDPALNGFKHVVSATSNKIIVEETLVDEASANRTLVTLTEFEGNGIYVEKANYVEVTDMTCTDMRHGHAIAFDPATTRALVVDGVTCHKGAAGALSAVRAPDGALATATTDPANAEGVMFRNIKMVGFGSGAIPISNGIVNGTVGAPTTVAQDPANLTGAGVYFGNVSDAATNYDPAGTGVDTEDLSNFARLS